MKLYLQNFYLDGFQIGDTLIYRLKRNAIVRFRIIMERCKVEYPDLFFEDNQDFHLGFNFMMRFTYKSKDGTDRRYVLSIQSTED